MKKLLFLLVACAVMAGCDKKETYDPRVSGGIVPYEGIKWGDSQELVHRRMMDIERANCDTMPDGRIGYIVELVSEDVAGWLFDYENQKLQTINYVYIDASGGDAAQEWERILSTTGIEQKESPFSGAGEYYAGTIGNVKIECLYYGEDMMSSDWMDWLGGNIEMKIFSLN